MPFPINPSVPQGPMSNEKAKELLDAIKELISATKESGDAMRSAASSMKPSGGAAPAAAAAPAASAPAATGGVASNAVQGATIAAVAGTAASQVQGASSSAEALGKGALQTFENIRQGSEVITKAVIDLKKKIDNGRAAWAQASAGIQSNIGGLVGAGHALGMSYSEAGSHLGQLVSQMPILTQLSDDQQKMLGKQSLYLKRLGVDAGLFASNATFMSRSLGLSGEGIESMNVQLYGLGKALKLPAGVIMKDFAEAMPKLIGFGKNAPDIFAKAERYANKLGISMKTIVNQMDNFDSFEDAAEKSGNLNVIMRQNLFDTNELLYASPTEKVKIFTNALDKYKNTTGKSFSDMDIFMKKAIAQQSGFTIEELENMSKHTGKQLDKLDKAKASDTGGDAMRASMKASAAATVSLSDRLERLADSITMMYSSLAGNPWSAFNRQMAEARKQIAEFHKFKKENPVLGALMQEAMDQGAARGLGGMVGFTSLQDAFNHIQLAFLDPANISKYGKMITDLMGDKNPAIRAFASKMNMQGMYQQIADIMKEGGGDADLKEFFNESMKKFNEAGEAGKAHADQILEQVKQEIVSKKQLAKAAASGMAMEDRENWIETKPGENTVLTPTPLKLVQQPTPQPGTEAPPAGPVEQMKQVADGTAMFKDLPEKIKTFGGPDQLAAINQAVQEMSTGLSTNVVDSIKLKFEENKQALEDAIKTPTTAAVTSAFTSLQPGSAEGLALAGLGTIVTGMQNINSVQINPQNNKEIERLIKNLKEINKITINDALILGIEKLNKAITDIVPALEKLQTKKDALKETFGSIEGKQVEQIAILAKALEDYAKAADKAKMSSTGPAIEAIKGLLGAVSEATAEAWSSAGINSSELGNAMAGPIVNELKRLFGR